MLLTSLKGVDAVLVLAGQDHHRPPEPGPGHPPTTLSAGDKLWKP